MAEPTLHILMIGPVPRIYGGISAVVGNILDSELPRRHRIRYLAEGTRQGPLSKVWRFLATVVRAAWLLLARRTVDVLHLHAGDGSSFYRHLAYLALGRLSRTPVIFHWHLPGDASAATSFYEAGGSARRRLVRWALDAADRVVVLSPSWLPALERIAPGCRAVAVPNPVDCTAIRPRSGPAEVDRPVILFLGDFSARKGARDLLAAAGTVVTAHPAASFTLCGGTPPADVVELAERLGQAVRFPGFVRGPDKLRLLQEAALLVLPSYAEGMPIAVLEGMAAGLAVVTTPVGGIPDFFVDGRNGLLVTPGDIRALAAALNELLAAPALRRQMGRHNRLQAVAEFDLPAYARRLEALYLDVTQH